MQKNKNSRRKIDHLSMIQKEVVDAFNLDFAATFLDFLSERKHLKDRLNRLEQYNIKLERLKSFHDLIMENIPIGVVATDVKGYVVLMNRVLERMSLLRIEECLGKDCLR